MSLDTFARAKLTQNYQPANARPACIRCAHRSNKTAGLGGWQCMKGGFYVTTFGVCSAYAPRPQGATS